MLKVFFVSLNLVASFDDLASEKFEALFNDILLRLKRVTNITVALG